MKKSNILRQSTWAIVLSVFVFVGLPDSTFGQRMRAASAGGGGARPTSSRPMNSNSMGRPAANPPAQARPNPSYSRPSNNMSRPSNSSQRPSVNGGSNKVANQKTPPSKVGTIGGSRPAAGPERPSTSTRPGTKETGNGNINGSSRPGNNLDRPSNQGGNRPQTSTPSRPSTGSSNRPNTGGNRPGNNINIDNSTNININNNYRPNGNVGYRPPYRPYPRPPYYWGGYGFSYYRPYYYHPYTPYYWGPMWHPFGFFVATVAVTAIIVSVENQRYHYDSGVFYIQQNDGYVVVEAPQGATVKVIPNEAEKVEVSPTINNYYYGGTFYEKTDGGYTVVPPPAGSVVDKLPEGAEEVKVGEVTYVRYGETYYLPVQVDGKNMYEIVQVEEAEDK